MNHTNYMAIKIWEKNAEPTTYVEAIYGRVIKLLPVITGLSVTEVEQGGFFIRSRDGLLQIVNSKFFPEVFQFTCDILDDLNKVCFQL